METLTQTPTSAPAFHADDTEQVTDYRTLSALAIVSLLIGLASPLCLAWPLLMGIPLLGAVVSIFALRRIDASDGALAGRWVATAGLVLCVFSGTVAVSRDLVTRSIRTRQAEAFGRDWIELLLNGEKEQAFQLTSDAHRREPIPEPGMAAPEKTPKELFLENTLITELAAAGADSKIEIGETQRYEPQPRRQFIIQKDFDVNPHEAGGTHGHDAIEVRLTLQRSRLAREPQSRWLVSGYENLRPAVEAAHHH